MEATVSVLAVSLNQTPETRLGAWTGTDLARDSVIRTTATGHVNNGLLQNKKK